MPSLARRSGILLVLGALVLTGCTSSQRSGYPGYEAWRSEWVRGRLFGSSVSGKEKPWPPGYQVETRGAGGAPIGAYGAASIELHVSTPQGGRHVLPIDLDALWPDLANAGPGERVTYYATARPLPPGLVAVCVRAYLDYQAQPDALLIYDPAVPALRETLRDCGCRWSTPVGGDRLWIPTSRDALGSAEYEWRRWRLSADGRLSGGEVRAHMGRPLVYLPGSDRLFAITRRGEVQEYDDGGAVIGSWKVPAGDILRPGFGDLEVVVVGQSTAGGVWDPVLTVTATVYGLDTDDSEHPWTLLEQERSRHLNPGP